MTEIFVIINIFLLLGMNNFLKICLDILCFDNQVLKNPKVVLLDLFNKIDLVFFCIKIPKIYYIISNNLLEKILTLNLVNNFYIQIIKFC